MVTVVYGVAVEWEEGPKGQQLPIMNDSGGRLILYKYNCLVQCLSVMVVMVTWYFNKSIFLDCRYFQYYHPGYLRVMCHTKKFSKEN